MPAKKQPLKLQAPPSSDSESEDEGKQLEISISPISPTVSAVTTVSKSSKSSASSASSDDDDEDEIDLVHLVSNIQDDIKGEIKEVQNEIALMMEIVEKKKQLIKEKTKKLKLWEKRVSTPTTAENASLAVKVKENERQVHNDLDGSLWYKSGSRGKQYLKVSAVKISTKSVREAGKPVLDGKEAKVHIKDPTVTVSDLEEVGETELVEKLNLLSSK